MMKDSGTDDMANIVFFCIPAYGHTNPTLGVVRELVSRGHEVHYYSFDQFKEAIEETGASYISCDGYDLNLEVDEEQAERIGKDMILSTKLLVNSTLAMDAQLEEDMKRIKPDVIVADSVAYWGKLTAMKLGIPFVSSTTTFAFNKDSASIMKPTGKELVRMLLDIPKTRKLMKPLRDKGYPADNIISVVQNDNDTETIVYTSKLFQPYADSFSDHYHFVGPILKEPKAQIHKTRDKLIYIALGTVDTRHPGFYRDCVEAFRDSDHQVIIAGGNKIDISQIGDVPDHIKIYTFVDQVAVLRKADAFITHCGMNSASEGLYNGVPLVLFPQTTEQGGVANRVEELGAGKRLESGSPEAIRQAVDDILSNNHFRENAEKIAASLRACTGAAGAADAIENLIRLWTNRKTAIKQ